MSDDPLKDLQLAYRQALGNEKGRDVLEDLRAFCFATMTTGSGDYEDEISNERMREREGRRQVFMRIMTMLKIDVEDIYSIEIPDPDGDF